MQPWPQNTSFLLCPNQGHTPKWLYTVVKHAMCVCTVTVFGNDGKEESAMPNAQLLVFHTLTTHYTHTPTRRQARRFFVVKSCWGVPGGDNMALVGGIGGGHIDLHTTILALSSSRRQARKFLGLKTTVQACDHLVASQCLYARCACTRCVCVAGV